MHNAQDIDNFLWNMKQYFDDMNLDKDEKKIQIAITCLADTATLWRRKCYMNIVKGIKSVETCDALKRELKIYPKNIEFKTHKKF